MIFDSIMSGKSIDKEILERWKCKDEEDFLIHWRGNSEEAYKKWLIESYLK